LQAAGFEPARILGACIRAGFRSARSRFLCQRIFGARNLRVRVRLGGPDDKPVFFDTTAPDEFLLAGRFAFAGDRFELACLCASVRRRCVVREPARRFLRRLFGIGGEAEYL